MLDAGWEYRVQRANPSRTEGGQNCKNIGNFTTLSKPHNIGTHLKVIETSFQLIRPLHCAETFTPCIFIPILGTSFFALIWAHFVCN
jgi:hypothetical protein